MKYRAGEHRSTKITYYTANKKEVDFKSAGCIICNIRKLKHTQYPASELYLVNHALYCKRHVEEKKKTK